MSPIIGIIVTLAILGVVVWLILQLPMPPIFRNLIIGAAAIVGLIFLLQSLGGSTGLHL